MSTLNMEPTEAQVKEVVGLMMKNYNQFAIAEMMGLKEWQVQYIMKYAAENKMFKTETGKGTTTLFRLQKLETRLFESIEKLHQNPNDFVLRSLVSNLQHEYSYALV